MMKLSADNLRITKPEIREALKNRDPRPVQELVERCAAQGPFALDVNTGPLGKNPEADMRFFIEAAESVTDLPLLMDTSNPRAMVPGPCEPLPPCTKSTLINPNSKKG